MDYSNYGLNILFQSASPCKGLFKVTKILSTVSDSTKISSTADWKFRYPLANFVSQRQGVILELILRQIFVHNSTLTGRHSHFSKLLYMGQLCNVHQNHQVELVILPGEFFCIALAYSEKHTYCIIHNLHTSLINYIWFQK